MRKIFLLIVLVVSLFGNTIDIAKDLFDNKEKYKEAIEIFEKYKDDGEAQYYLGKAYLYGMGVEKNEKKAFEFAKKSADKNNASGLNLVGAIYQFGEDIKKDEAKAFEFYTLSANLGNTKAMKNLANMYANHNSTFLKRDFNQIIFWMKKAYTLGDLDAPFFIGIFYKELNDYDNAIKYLRILIEEKKSTLLPNAYYALGNVYLNQKQFELAYLNYLESANLKYEDSILTLIYEKDLHQFMKDEELLYWMKKGVDMKLELAYAPLYKYYLEKKDFKNLKVFLEKLYYEDKNLEMGCNLSSYYLNLLNNQPEKSDYEKAYYIAKEIIDNNPDNKQIYSCYQNLSFLYSSGKFVSKDLEKAKEFQKISSKVSVDFASKTAENDLNDMNIKSKYEIKQFEKNQIIDEKIYPILNNFTKKEQVFSVIESKDYFFLSVNDKSIKMYDKNNLKLLNEFRFYVSSGMNGNALQMAFDENKKLLYFSVINNYKDFSKNDLIHVLDITTGKIIKTLKNIYAIKNTYLNISDDGKYLIAINNKNLINIINIETNENQHYDLNREGNFVAANIIKEKDDYILYLGNKDNGKIYKYSLNQKRNISIEDYNNQIKFKSFSYNQAEKIFDNKNSLEIQYISLNEKNNIEVKLNDEIKEFDLKDFKLNNLEKLSKINNSNSSNLMVNQKNDGNILEFTNKKDNLKKEFLLPIVGIRLLDTYQIKDKYILLITSDISLMPILNDKGEVIANLQGISSFHKDIFFRDNNLILLGQDNVIHIFNLSDLDFLKYSNNQYDEEMLNGFSNQVGKNKEEIIKEFENMNIEITDDQLVGMQNEFKLSFTPTKEQIKNFFQLFMHKKEIISPQLSLYIQNENDWIMYISEGLFTYGGNGKDLLKYHQNQGLYKEAKIIENDKLFDKFYRPDLIKKILAGEKVEIPMDVKSVILNILPPELKILKNKMLNIKDIELTYQICDAGNGMADLKLLINGQAINPPQSRGIAIEKVDNQTDKCKIYKSVHTLYPGTSTIELKAYDKEKYIANVSDKLEINANYKIVEKSSNISKKEMNKDENYEVVDKANLYLLSLAVDDYENKNLNLKYPVKDVNTIKEEIKLKSKSTFENIYTFDLYNEKVTKENINQMFDDISNKIKYNDTFILYIAGHGLAKDGKYQLVSYKINEKISIDDLKQNLSKIVTNKSLVLLDTCQSGAAIDDIVDKTATVNRLSHDDNRNYIVASSKDQVALEGYNEHGVFTYSVLDAFKNNENLKVWGLADHVSEVVPKITQEKFHFEQRPEAKLNHNFVLSGEN